MLGALAIVSNNCVKFWCFLIALCSPKQFKNEGELYIIHGKAFGSSNSWRTKLWSSIALCQSRSKYARKEQWRRGKQGMKTGDTAAVFHRTFGALPEVHFLHSIYHFKAQEVNNPMLQAVCDSELKRRSYSHCKSITLSWRKHFAKCCEITLLLRSDFAAFLYSKVFLLLTMHEPCREKGAGNLKVEANFAALWR